MLHSYFIVEVGVSKAIVILHSCFIELWNKPRTYALQLEFWVLIYMHLWPESTLLVISLIPNALRLLVNAKLSLYHYLDFFAWKGSL